MHRSAWPLAWVLPLAWLRSLALPLALALPLPHALALSLAWLRSLALTLPHALLRSLALPLALIAGSAGAQDWSQYTSDQDRFRIYAPGELQVEEISYASEYRATFPARLYSYEDDAGNRFSVTVVDYTDSLRIHTERARTEADYLLYWEVDIRASVAYAAANLRARGGEIVYDAYHYIDRVEGHQLHMVNPDGTRTYAAIYLHDSHLYIVEATVAPGPPPPGQFQQSLEFIDENGDRIRYQNFAEAVKVRGAPSGRNLDTQAD